MLDATKLKLDHPCMDFSDHYITPKWPAPKNIIAACTTRLGGNSLAPYSSFNPASHVGDNIKNVIDNRKKIIDDYQLRHPIRWLEQTHGTNAIAIDDSEASTHADACYTQSPQQTCAVLTADCLPLLVCNKAGTEVAAIHAGWRGLLNGIIENTITKLISQPNELLVWLGPAIGPKHFEVNDEIRQLFISKNILNKNAFSMNGQSIFADIFQLARNTLATMSITNIYGGEHCSFDEEDLFFSYRRDNKTTGRMASFIHL